MQQTQMLRPTVCVHFQCNLDKLFCINLVFSATAKIIYCVVVEITPVHMYVHSLNELNMKLNITFRST